MKRHEHAQKTPPKFSKRTPRIQLPKTKVRRQTCPNTELNEEARKPLARSLTSSVPTDLAPSCLLNDIATTPFLRTTKSRSPLHEEIHHLASASAEAVTFPMEGPNGRFEWKHGQSLTSPLSSNSELEIRLGAYHFQSHTSPVSYEIKLCAYPILTNMMIVTAPTPLQETTIPRKPYYVGVKCKSHDFDKYAKTKWGRMVAEECTSTSTNIQANDSDETTRACICNLKFYKTLSRTSSPH
ncbi:hypothetical protein BJ508DRAFT_315794 [Ascobolus immersus RN42]|uniref:Uncharacterized protein n=1 Tax=Ascobolus immersus RN42 TaxID=1160509 RepID=A0A3N4H987_ASCIM|nr:hypothetical protein BJ508DRAFT_315794 [Ascobolus immersus RN42]